MSKTQVVKKYSRAILNSVDIDDVPAVINELKTFSRLIETHRQVKLLFAGQIFSETEKESAFDALTPRLKMKVPTIKLLKNIMLQGHLSLIKEIISASIDMYNEKQKKATAVVVSSVALDARHGERLKSALEKMTDRIVTIENQVDESLLGGFIVRVGSTIFDSSVKGQLRMLKAELMR